MSVILSPPSILTFSEHQDPQALAPSPEFLVLKNTGSAHVAFKIKTTAPGQYAVRPNTGKVEPNGQITLQVYTQPVQTDAKERTKDHLLVQAVDMTPDEEETLDMAQMWQRIETEEKERMNRLLLKCVFSPNPSATRTLPETTPPASPKPTSIHHVNASPPAISPDAVFHEAIAVHEENARRMNIEVTKNKATIVQLQKDLANTSRRLEDAERRCEQYKTSLNEKYGARHVQLLMEQHEHEHPILVVWVAATLTFVVLRLVI